ncbi:MAG: Nif3-like dinuclear metal center hexameric protein [Marinilabiliales bacterium]
MLLKDFIATIEKDVPLQLQESYDNSGLLVGDTDKEISSALICIDVTKEIINEAIENNCDLIISHHPVVFKPLNKFTGSDEVQRIVIEAIKKDIAIYSMHTNLDKINKGVSYALCEKLNLKNCRILLPDKKSLKKIITFVPSKHVDSVRRAMFDAGAGHIGNYDMCSFNIEGQGSFRALEGTNPYVGSKNKLHFEKEVRVETIVPDFLVSRVVAEMKKAHPYEEVAFDIYPLDNDNEYVGLGMIGQLEAPVNNREFLLSLKEKLNCKLIRHSKLLDKKINKVAVCGGSGSNLISQAIKNNADVFITADVKYHQFFETENKIIIADIGHYESEQFAKEIIYNIITKKIPNFAVRLSDINTNPINYL